MDWDYGWGHHAFGWFWMLLFWIFIIAGIVAIIRWFSSGQGPVQEKTALDVLNRRYARGEIDREEYEEKRRALERR